MAHNRGLILEPGTSFGPYRIVAPIGAGGMGEVYRAHDPRLNREVALKILRPEFADDADRLQRFVREAQALASLNHPHIAQIYGVEDLPPSASGRVVRALVMEFVEGEDLSARLARAPLPLDEALEIARQIAEALEAAHEQGIIHRDLKPANVKIRHDGTVKVLDFGLAKALTSGASSPSAATVANSPTFTRPVMTSANVILGTAAYMSPEQARGKPVDKRSDIWSFGVVLYEMLTRRPAYRGETVTDLMAAVMTRDPDWSVLPEAVPTSVRRLLRRCLEKDPRVRLRDIGEARVVLAKPGHADGSEANRAAGDTRARGFGRILPWAVASVALVAAAAALWPKAAPEAPIRKLEIALPADAVAPTVVLPPTGPASPTGPAIASSSLIWRSSRPTTSRRQRRRSVMRRSGLTIRRSSATAMSTANSGSCPLPADRRGSCARSRRPVN